MLFQAEGVYTSRKVITQACKQSLRRYNSPIYRTVGMDSLPPSKQVPAA